MLRGARREKRFPGAQYHFINYQARRYMLPPHTRRLMSLAAMIVYASASRECRHAAGHAAPAAR